MYLGLLFDLQSVVGYLVWTEEKLAFNCISNLCNNRQIYTVHFNNYIDFEIQLPFFNHFVSYKEFLQLVF